MAAAVFLDLENIGISNMAYDKALETVREVMDQIATCPLLDELAVCSAYVAHSNSKNTMLRNILKDFGIALIEVAPLEHASKKANLVDFKLYADALELAARSRKVDTIALASGDSDFGFLCKAVKRMGKRFVLITRGESISQPLVLLADDWVNATGEYSRVNAQKLWLRRLPPESLPREMCGEERLRLMFLRAAEDLLLMRYARLELINLTLLRAICDCYAGMPNFRILGVKSQMQCFAYLLRGLPFCVGLTSSQPYLHPRNALPTGAALVEPPALAGPQELLARAAGLPDGYTREKAEEWRQFFKDRAGSLKELLAYLRFFERTGVLELEGEAPRFLPKAQYKQAVLARLDLALREAQCSVEEHEYKAFAKQL